MERPCLWTQLVIMKQQHTELGEAKGPQVLPFPHPSWAPAQPQEGRVAEELSSSPAKQRESAEPRYSDPRSGK